jgi:hypothetical protein
MRYSQAAPAELGGKRIMQRLLLGSSPRRMINQR